MSKSYNRDHVNASKAMSYLLRHGAEKERMMIRSDGFIFVEDILNHRSLRNLGTRMHDVKAIVNTNDKKRFELK